MTAAVPPANELSRAQWRKYAVEWGRDHRSGWRRDRRPGGHPGPLPGRYGMAGERHRSICHEWHVHYSE